MRKTLVGVAGALLVACSAPKAPDPVLSGTLEESLVEVTAVIEKVDRAARTVTIRRPDGKRLTVAVGDEVKNLPHVDAGDEVMLSYYESIAFDVREPRGATKPKAVAAAETARAAPGEKPSAREIRMLTVTAAIAAIDRATPAVTLRGPEGATRTIKVRDPKKLEEVEVGDVVEIHYTQAVAVSVRKTSGTPR